MNYPLENENKIKKDCFETLLCRLSYFIVTILLLIFMILILIFIIRR